MLLLSQQLFQRHTLRSQRTQLTRGSGVLWRAISTKEADDITRKIFAGNKESSVKELQDHVNKNVNAMDSTNIANVIFLASKQGLKLNAHQLTLLSNRLKRQNNKLNKLIVSKMLFGFNARNDKPASVKHFLKVLTQKVIASDSFILDGQGVGNSLYGLKNMTSESDEVRALLSELRHHVDHCTTELKSQEIGNALFGLKSMSSESKEVRGLLNSLEQRVVRCPEELSAQTIGNSVYSLQNMDSKHVEVRKLLASLSVKINMSREKLTSQHIGNSFYGLQNTNSKHKESRSLLKSLTNKLRQYKYNFSSQEIGSALFGLQGMQSACPEVQEALKLFSVSIKRMKHRLDSHAVGMILYGIQSMNSEHVAVRSFLAAVFDKITRDEGVHGSLEMKGKEISSAMLGMQRMHAADREVQEILMFLHQQLVHCKETISSQSMGNIIYSLKNNTCDHKVIRDLVETASARIQLLPEPLSMVTFGSALYGLRCMSSDVPEVRHLLTALCDKLTPLESSNNGDKDGDGDDFESGRDADTLTRSICNALYGLQCMDSEHSEVRRILAMLSTRLEVCPPASLTAQGFGSAMYGMQLMTCRGGGREGCSGEDAEFEGLLQVLYDKVSAESRPEELIDVRAIGNSLYGLISAMKYPSEVRAQDLLRSILSLLLHAADGVVKKSVVASTTKQKCDLSTGHSSIHSSSKNNSPDADTDIVSVEDMQDLWRSLVLFSHFTDSSAALTPDLRSHLAKLCADLSRHSPHSTLLHIPPRVQQDDQDQGQGRGGAPAVSGRQSKKAISKMERRVQEQVDILLQNNPTVHITHNEMLYGFDADIVLRVTSVDDNNHHSHSDSHGHEHSQQVPVIIRNVEVDDITHLQPRRRKFCNLRDIYLEDKYGIKVSRIRHLDRKHLSDEALKEAVLGHLKALKLFVITQQTQHTFF